MKKKAKVPLWYKDKDGEWTRASDNVECDFESDGKCVYTGFPNYPPLAYNLVCVCCRLRQVQGELIENRESQKELVAVMTEIIPLLLKFLPRNVATEAVKGG